MGLQMNVRQQNLLVKVAAGGDWLDVGRRLSSEYRWKTGTWAGLPTALYAEKGSERLGRLVRDVRVYHYDQREEIQAECLAVIS